VDRSHQLAEFLRARRARTTPEAVGISNGDRRRVPGLRREELAMLAGLSANYYTRLEQGRGHRPSEKVLEALARALQLDADATTHLFRLGRGVPSFAAADPSRSESVAPELQDLLDAWPITPALVHGRRLDVLASNSLARALTPMSEPGRNMLRTLFLDLEVRGRYADPDAASASAVAYLRANTDGDADDPQLGDLVRELSQASEDFRRLWAHHDVQSMMSGDARYFHPVVGPMLMRFQTFAVEGVDRQTLMAVHCTPGSRDEQALIRLAELTASRNGASSESASPFPPG
jgi:transcriptional regulator with XRE-family HTH domain